MEYLLEKLIKYRGLINIITILLMLLLPIPNEKFILFFFMVLFIVLFQLITCLNSFDSSFVWNLLVPALLAVIYIVISVSVVCRSLYIIKRRLGVKMDITYSIFISLAGFYSLYCTVGLPSRFSIGMLTLFFIFNVLRCIPHLKKLD